MSGRTRRESHERRWLATTLRDRGLTLRAIGAQLGISHQGVQQLLRRRSTRTVSCGHCGDPLKTKTPVHGRNGPALCLGCLAQRPDAPFALRLRSLRLAAGLTQRELAEMSGVANGTISTFEVGEGVPKRRTQEKLARVLGPWLVGARE